MPDRPPNDSADASDSSIAPAAASPAAPGGSLSGSLSDALETTAHVPSVAPSGPVMSNGVLIASLVATLLVCIPVMHVALWQHWIHVTVPRHERRLAAQHRDYPVRRTEFEANWVGGYVSFDVSRDTSMIYKKRSWWLPEVDYGMVACFPIPHPAPPRSPAAIDLTPPPAAAPADAAVPSPDPDSASLSEASPPPLPVPVPTP